MTRPDTCHACPRPAVKMVEIDVSSTRGEPLDPVMVPMCAECLSEFAGNGAANFSNGTGKGKLTHKFVFF